MKTSFFCLLVFLMLATAKAQLFVTVSSPRATGQKAIVTLVMTNGFADSIESARAVCFLLDQQGKVIGQSTKWVIGQNRTALEPKAKTLFNFVVTSREAFTTNNLTARVNFTRMIMESGKLVDTKTDVQIKNAQ